jgi:ATP phosphoribosyltransferase regulatory subunit
MFDREKKFAVKLPFGFRDIFPVELEERNNIKDMIREEFNLWGYGEIKTPVVEYTQNISAGAGDKWKDKIINFFDVDGSLISLRTDMTIPIARLTGMRIKRKDLPVRFCYFANSFRRSLMQKGEKREYNQAGLECIGNDSITSDLEVLVLLTNVLKAVVKDNFRIGIGHIGISEGLCDWLQLNELDKKYIKDNLIHKNFVEIENFLYKKDKNRALLFLSFLKPVKDINWISRELLSLGDPKVTEGINYLTGIFSSLEKLNLSKYLIIDPGILRQFEYYSGLLFEVYSPDINEILGSGGRYDGLIKKFGLQTPATGFALDLDLLHKSAKGCNPDIFRKKFKIMLFGEDNDFIQYFHFSDQLRSLGFAVEIYYGDCPDIDATAKLKGADIAVKIDKAIKNINVIDMDQGSSFHMGIEEFMDELKNGRYAKYSNT